MRLSIFSIGFIFTISIIPAYSQKAYGVIVNGPIPLYNEYKNTNKTILRLESGKIVYIKQIINNDNRGSWIEASTTIYKEGNYTNNNSDDDIDVIDIVDGWIYQQKRQSEYIKLFKTWNEASHYRNSLEINKKAIDSFFAQMNNSIWHPDDTNFIIKTIEFIKDDYSIIINSNGKWGQQKVKYYIDEMITNENNIYRFSLYEAVQNIASPTNNLLNVEILNQSSIYVWFWSLNDKNNVTYNKLNE